ncbi:MAG: hypothetical protein DRJ03_22760 [Chloroflexi bacterium]|nr:MAG: hypothetical protein DRJ03_22760 [Chloroflexota bacterium]
MTVIPKPSEETVEKFMAVTGADESLKRGWILYDPDRASALVLEEVSFDDPKLTKKFDAHVYAGFWHFDKKQLRHEDLFGLKIGIMGYVYSANLIANALKVTGNKVHLYIFNKGEEEGCLLMLSDKCGIFIAPMEVSEFDEPIHKFARPIRKKIRVRENRASFFDALSSEEVENLIERLSRELGILHV